MNLRYTKNGAIFLATLYVYSPRTPHGSDCHQNLARGHISLT